jgi:hypothetical protein
MLGPFLFLKELLLPFQDVLRFHELLFLFSDLGFSHPLDLVDLARVEQHFSFVFFLICQKPNGLELGKVPLVHLSKILLLHFLVFHVDNFS